MACCKCCCGGADCTEGQQGKCCCGGSGGTCCQANQYCCNGVCQNSPCVNCDSALFISVDRGGVTGGTCIYSTALGAEVGSYFSCFCPLPTTAFLGINAGASGYEQGDGQTVRFLAGNRKCVGGVSYPMTVSFVAQWTNFADHGKPMTITASWAGSTQNVSISPGANMNCPYSASPLYAHIFENGTLVFGTNPLP